MAFGDFTVVRSTVKRALNSSGVLAEVAFNTPAFEFNADGSYKGLLVEPGATNLYTYSEQFDNSDWTKVASSITANAIVAPDGTTTADKIVEDNTTAIHRVEQSKTLTANPHSQSFYLKAGERTWGGIRGVNSVSENCKAWFNLSTGAVGTVEGTGASGSIEELPDGWYRCTLTIASASASSFEYRAFVATGDGVDNYLGDGTSGIYLWGAQLEAGSVATSYIPTTASTANRTADDISLSSASSLIGQGEGTLYCEVEWRSDAGVGKPGQYLCEIGDGTANNRIVLYQNNGADEIQMFLNSNGVVVVNQGASSTAYSGTVKLALAYKQDDTVIAKGGSIISTDTSVDLSALGTLTHVFLGQSYINGEQANMWIRSLALFPTRLSNAQLQALTT